MAVAVLMPKLGLTMEEGTLVLWLKQEGETVEQGEPLLEISTEKVTAEVESPAAGVLRGLRAQAGETVPVGEAVAFVVAPGEVLELPAPASAARPKPAQLRPTIVKAGLPASMSPPSSMVVSATPIAARFAAEHGVDLSQVHSTGPSGQVTKRDIVSFLTGREVSPGVAERAMMPRLATPIVRRLAQERKIDLSLVPGSGPAGLVVERDLAAHLASLSSEAGPGRSRGIPVREQRPLMGRRKIVAERMQQSARQAPHIRLGIDVEMSAVQARRAGASLTAYLGWIVAQTLLDHPMLNASLQDDQILIFDTVNLGIAVDTDDGLIVPVVPQAHRLSLKEVDEAVGELARLAREGRLSLDNVSGGTFTLSNLGMLGIDSFEAIINPPQAAIMAVGRVRLRPWAKDMMTVTVCPIMTVTVSADHRLVDGATVARFLDDFARRLA